MRYAVILAGGGGTRLWPASRRARPKQFLPLGAVEGESLLSSTARRLSPLCPPERVCVVTSAALATQVAGQLPAATVLAEPIGRNTAAALGLAAVHLLHADPDAVLGAMPADHHIFDEAAFVDVAGRAFDAAAASGAIVTIGVVPTRPETAFGYIKLGAETEHSGVRAVDDFVEKPDASAAAAYLADGSYSWNAGMFFCRADVLLAEIEEHMPDTHAALETIATALAAGETGAAQTAQVYPGLPSVSIDYGVMEKAERVLAIPGDFGWNDVGSWSALAETRRPREDGNTVVGAAVAIDATRNVVVCDDGHLVAVVGVDDLVVVQSGDAILVVPKNRAQDVRDVVAALESDPNGKRHL